MSLNSTFSELVQQVVLPGGNRDKSPDFFETSLLGHIVGSKAAGMSKDAQTGKALGSRAVSGAGRMILFGGSGPEDSSFPFTGRGNVVEVSLPRDGGNAATYGRPFETSVTGAPSGLPRTDVGEARAEFTANIMTLELQYASNRSDGANKSLPHAPGVDPTMVSEISTGFQNMLAKLAVSIYCENGRYVPCDGTSPTFTGTAAVPSPGATGTFQIAALRYDRARFLSSGPHRITIGSASDPVAYSGTADVYIDPASPSMALGQAYGGATFTGSVSTIAYRVGDVNSTFTATPASQANVYIYLPELSEWGITTMNEIGDSSASLGGVSVSAGRGGSWRGAGAGSLSSNVITADVVRERHEQILATSSNDLILDEIGSLENNGVKAYMNPHTAKTLFRRIAGGYEYNAKESSVDIMKSETRNVGSVKVDTPALAVDSLCPYDEIHFVCLDDYDFVRNYNGVDTKMAWQVPSLYWADEKQAVPAGARFLSSIGGFYVRDLEAASGDLTKVQNRAGSASRIWNGEGNNADIWKAYFNATGNVIARRRDRTGRMTDFTLS